MQDGAVSSLHWVSFLFAVLVCMCLQVGTFLQHSATFIAGFIIAFTRSWDMTLVLVGCLPFVAGVGAVMAKLTTSLSNKGTAAYTEVRMSRCLFNSLVGLCPVGDHAAAAVAAMVGYLQSHG